MANKRTVLLLSANHPSEKCYLEKRRKCATHLKKPKYKLKPIIMEDFKFPKKLQDAKLLQKFRYLLHKQPEMICIIIPKHAQMGAVVFEFVATLYELGESKFVECVRFFVENGTDMKRIMPVYAIEYIEEMRSNNFMDWESSLARTINIQYERLP